MSVYIISLQLYFIYGDCGVDVNMYKEPD